MSISEKSQSLAQGIEELLDSFIEIEHASLATRLRMRSAVTKSVRTLVKKIEELESAYHAEFRSNPIHRQEAK